MSEISRVVAKIGRYEVVVTVNGHNNWVEVTNPVNSCFPKEKLTAYKPNTKKLLKMIEKCINRASELAEAEERTKAVCNVVSQRLLKGEE